MKRTLALVLAIILVIGLASGCAKPAPSQDTPAAVEDQNNTPEDTNPNEGASGKIADKATDATGRFNGKIDGNSVEIEMTPTDILAFRSSEVTEQLNGINDGDKVRFSYESNENGQLVIISIEKIEE